MCERQVKEFDGGFGRDGRIWVAKEECDLCGGEKICIASDGSEGKYRYTYMCPECVKAECEKGLGR